MGRWAYTKKKMAHMKYTFSVFKCKESGKLLGLIEEVRHIAVGLFEPGIDGNYYDKIIFCSNDSHQSPESYMEYLKKNVFIDDEFSFNWNNIEIVEFEV